MSDVVIRAQNLSKRYRIGVRRHPPRHPTLRDYIAESVRSLVTQRRAALPAAGFIWALKDASFEIKLGEAVGVIGRNGAGKSTLLKILARIVTPTAGRAEIHGRIGSLLEIGTGFHPELTGRENIYLSGAILGMRKREVDRRFDEIVAFSEIEQFLETPVKRYSSGMHVRLAFAVAAHLETEILLVDEVLAVGDAAFQVKCLNKMAMTVAEGRTIFFVSHNLAAVQNLCPRAILISDGRIVLDAPTERVVGDYLARLTSGSKDAFIANPDRSGDGPVRLTDARILDESHRPVRSLVAGRAALFECSYEKYGSAKSCRVVFTIFNQLGVPATNFDTTMTNGALALGSKGTLSCLVPILPLPMGQYRLAAAVEVNGRLSDRVPNALMFSVESSTFFPTGRAPSANYCSCMVAHQWEHRVSSERTLEPLHSGPEQP